MEKKLKELCTKITGAHPIPQFSVDERLLIVVKCTEKTEIVFWTQTDVFKGSF